MTTNVLIVDDHGLVATAVCMALQVRGFKPLVCRAFDRESVIAAALGHAADCALLDVDLGPGYGPGVNLVRPLRDIGVKVVMMTAETNPLVLAACLEAGAAGWVAKDGEFDAIVDSIESVVKGDALIGRGIARTMLTQLQSARVTRHAHNDAFGTLSPRECDVLRAMVDGLSAEEIASRQVTSLTTVRAHIRSILRKLNVHSQLAAVASAHRSGWASR